jgi:hypothetical protein
LVNYTTFLSKIVQEIFLENPICGLSLQVTDFSFEKQTVPGISDESACFILIFLKIQTLFQPVSDWYQKIKSSFLFERYLRLVNFIVSRRAFLKNCLVSCRHCQIPFITYPCNAGRKDLGCPFGCREFLRSENSKKRSLQYYRSEEGKKKKKRLNQKRCLDLSEKTQETSQILHSGSSPPRNNFPHDLGIKENHTIPLVRPEFSIGGIFYLQSVVSLLEGRRFSRDEIERFVTIILRQLSLDTGVSKRYSHDKEPDSS